MAMTTIAPVQELKGQRLRLLRELERKVLWLSAWTVHHANHIRPNRDGIKVGGHQASCASLATVMTALYFSVLRPEDRVAVKPHASPVFHAIQYLFGHQTRDKLERFRALGGADVAEVELEPDRGGVRGDRIVDDRIEELTAPEDVDEIDTRRGRDIDEMVI